MPVYVNDKEIPYSAKYEQYSDDPEQLRALLETVTIKATRCGITLNALRYAVTVERDGRRFNFDYFASHNDAQLYADNIVWKHGRSANIKARRGHVAGLPYDLLCCIGSDYGLLDCEPEDLGMDSDSIKDMAKWSEMREHAKELRSCLRLSEAEQYSLPA